ncbi:MAG: hypothetical protein GX539_12615 [Candidatus Cloacimonetes bacterium]|jgi:hypothetical protein|nr:hypothetical protein [Candidatus Cloacimonadota bacterium]
MRKQNIPILALLVVVAGAMAGRLPVERTADRFPELAERWDYRVVRVTERAGSTHVSVTHASHARMTEEERAERARQVAAAVAARRAGFATPMVVELSWTWHSDLMTKHGSSRFTFGRTQLD